MELRWWKEARNAYRIFVGKLESAHLEDQEGDGMRTL
jgi:hypothetical protein